MNKKEIRHAVNTISDAIENIKCEDVSHKKNHQHTIEEICPVIYNLNRQMFLISEFVKKKNV